LHEKAPPSPCINSFVYYSISCSNFKPIKINKNIEMNPATPKIKVIFTL